MYKKQGLILGMIFLFIFTTISFSQVALNKNLVYRKVFSEKLIVKGNLFLIGRNGEGFLYSSNITVRLDKGVSGYEIINVYLNTEKYQKGNGDNYSLSSLPFNFKNTGLYTITAEVKRLNIMNSKPIKVDLATITIKNFMKDVEPKYSKAVPYKVWKNGLNFKCGFYKGSFNPEVKLREIPPHGWIYTSVAGNGNVILPADKLKPKMAYDVQLEKSGSPISDVMYHKNAANGSYVSFTNEYTFGFFTGAKITFK